MCRPSSPAPAAVAATDGYKIWLAAREANDFSLYAPVLEQNFKLARDYIACFDDYEHPYDVVLDDYRAGHAHEPQVQRAAGGDARSAAAADRAAGGS